MAGSLHTMIYTCREILGCGLVVLLLMLCVLLAWTLVPLMFLLTLAQETVDDFANWLSAKSTQLQAWRTQQPSKPTRRPLKRCTGHECNCNSRGMCRD